MTKPEFRGWIVPVSTKFGFRISSFLRHWVFRHSSLYRCLHSQRRAVGSDSQIISNLLDLLATVAGYDPDHNDRIAFITRADLAQRVAGRHDFDATMRSLGLAVTACIADYGSKNPGGPDDKRLPWPSPVGLADYRPDSAYDDVSVGALSGRLADIVDTTNVTTGNSVART